MSNYEYAQASDDDLALWEMNAAAEEFAAMEDAREMEQLRWAEAGGYRSGLPRPA